MCARLRANVRSSSASSSSQGVALPVMVNVVLGDKAVGLMQAKATSVSDFLGQIDPDGPDAAPIRERLTEEAEQLQRLAMGAQERDRILAMKSMAEDINLTSRGCDDKERRTRNRSKRDF